MAEIDVKTLRRWQTEARGFILIDTLPPTAFAKEHLPGSIHIVSDDVIALAPTHLRDKDADIVVYCASATCKRAGLSAERLISLGYQNVWHFVGGKRAWRDADLPFEVQAD